MEIVSALDQSRLSTSVAPFVAVNACNKEAAIASPKIGTNQKWPRGRTRIENPWSLAHARIPSSCLVRLGPAFPYRSPALISPRGTLFARQIPIIPLPPPPPPPPPPPRPPRGLGRATLGFDRGAERRASTGCLAGPRLAVFFSRRGAARSGFGFGSAAGLSWDGSAASCCTAGTGSFACPGETTSLSVDFALASPGCLRSSSCLRCSAASFSRRVSSCLR